MKKFVALSVFALLMSSSATAEEELPLRVEQWTHRNNDPIFNWNVTDVTFQSTTKLIIINRIVINEGTCEVPWFEPIRLKYGEKTQHTMLASQCSILKVEVGTDIGDFVFTW